MIDGSSVQLGGDDDVLIAHVARYDVFVELDSKLFADAKDAVCRSRCEQRTRQRHVLDNLRHFAINMYLLFVVRCGGERAELVFALRITDVIGHIDGQFQVARCRQQFVTYTGSVCFVRLPGIEFRPLRVARKAVLDTDIL